MDVAISNWKNKPHGPRVQAMAIEFIDKKLQLYNMYSDAMSDLGVSISLTDVISDCSVNCTTDVSVSTLRRW